VPLSQGLVREQDIAGKICEVITGKKQGCRSDDEVTLFDSTGIALQDSAPFRSNTSAPSPPASRKR
jgi:alanine dehydrogenase